MEKNICPYCSEEMPSGAKFCPCCGEKLPEKADNAAGTPSATAVCPVCGEGIDGSLAICPICNEPTGFNTSREPTIDEAPTPALENRPAEVSVQTPPPIPPTEGHTTEKESNGIPDMEWLLIGAATIAVVVVIVLFALVKCGEDSGGNTAAPYEAVDTAAVDTAIADYEETYAEEESDYSERAPEHYEYTYSGGGDDGYQFDLEIDVGPDSKVKGVMKIHEGSWLDMRGTLERGNQGNDLTLESLPEFDDPDVDTKFTLEFWASHGMDLQDGKLYLDGELVQSGITMEKR